MEGQSRSRKARTRSSGARHSPYTTHSSPVHGSPSHTSPGGSRLGWGEGGARECSADRSQSREPGGASEGVGGASRRLRLYSDASSTTSTVSTTSAASASASTTASAVSAAVSASSSGSSLAGSASASGLGSGPGVVFNSDDNTVSLAHRESHPAAPRTIPAPAGLHRRRMGRMARSFSEAHLPSPLSALWVGTGPAPAAMAATAAADREVAAALSGAGGPRGSPLQRRRPGSSNRSLRRSMSAMLASPSRMMHGLSLNSPRPAPANMLLASPRRAARRTLTDTPPPELVLSGKLPVVYNKNGIDYVSAEAVARLLTATRKSADDADLNFIVIDARFPFEYEHGHIASAVNLWTRSGLIDALIHDPLPSNFRLIFHCEFSSERAPDLCGTLRHTDRLSNLTGYRENVLSYPHIYVMRGGYKEFFHKFPALCTPSDYLPMVAPQYKAQLAACKSMRDQSIRSRSRSCSDLSLILGAPSPSSPSPSPSASPTALAAPHHPPRIMTAAVTRGKRQWEILNEDPRFRSELDPALLPPAHGVAHPLLRRAVSELTAALVTTPIARESNSFLFEVAADAESDGMSSDDDELYSESRHQSQSDLIALLDDDNSLPLPMGTSPVPPRFGPRSLSARAGSAPLRPRSSRRQLSHHLSLASDSTMSGHGLGHGLGLQAMSTQDTVAMSPNSASTASDSDDDHVVPRMVSRTVSFTLDQRPRSRTGSGASSSTSRTHTHQPVLGHLGPNPLSRYRSS